MKKCPYCEWRISDTAKKCKFCWEWIDKTSKLGWKKIDFVNLLLDNWIVILVIWLILYFIFFKDSSKTSLDTSDYNPSTLDSHNYEEDLDDEVINDDLEYKYDIKAENNWVMIWTDKWYTLLPGKLWECKLNSNTQITNFIEKINEADNWWIIDWNCPSLSSLYDDEYYNWIKDAFFIDNTYSLDQNWDINTEWPADRISLLGNYINNSRYSNWAEIDVNFLYTIQPDDDSEEPDWNLYHFIIKSSAFPIKYRKQSKNNDKVIFRDERQFLNLKSVNITATLSWMDQDSITCIQSSARNYVCYDADSVYNQIKKIYDFEYDKKEKHTDNIFLKSLSMFKNWISWDKNHIYIITDGEFKIGAEWEKKYLSWLKNKYKSLWKHDQWVDQTHNMTEFSMRYTNWYQKDAKYEQFRSEVIKTLKKEIPECIWTTINVVGLTRSAEYTPLAQAIYQQIFEPCTVYFK